MSGLKDDYQFSITENTNTNLIRQETQIEMLRKEESHNIEDLTLQN